MSRAPPGCRTRAIILQPPKLSLLFLPIQEPRNRGDRTRTCDIRFWRPTLYQLSYTPRRADSSFGKTKGPVSRGPLQFKRDLRLATGSRLAEARERVEVAHQRIATDVRGRLCVGSDVVFGACRRNHGATPRPPGGSTRRRSACRSGSAPARTRWYPSRSRCRRPGHRSRGRRCTRTAARSA